MNNNAIAFGGDEIYVGGFAIPEGDYALEFTAKMSTPKEGSQNVSRLGVEIKAHDLKDPEHQGEKAYTEFLSMGSKAHLSFAPNPDTGKGIVPIPGAAGVTMNDKTNWNIFRKSLYNCGLPAGVFTDDLSVLDGVHVHLGREPEPSDRAGFAKAATSEAAMMGTQASTTPKTIPVVTVLGDILDGDNGKPWEGGGGIPEPTAKPKFKAVAKPPVKAAAKPVLAKAKPAPAASEGPDETVVMQSAGSAVAEVLAKQPDGCPILKLKTTVFTTLKKVDEAMAQAVLDTYFSSDAALNGLIEGLGVIVDGASNYTVSGKQVVPA